VGAVCGQPLTNSSTASADKELETNRNNRMVTTSHMACECTGTIESYHRICLMQVLQ
jgi:hypothetical protein